MESTSRGQDDSVARVFAHHGARLVGRVALVVGDLDEARDVVQQAFVIALERGPSVSDIDLARWLAVVALRLAISERRRRRRWGLFPLNESDHQWAQETDPDLWRALSHLSRRSRAALVLTVVEGYTQEEVAHAFGARRSTVAAWISKAKVQLRQDIEVASGG